MQVTFIPGFTQTAESWKPITDILDPPFKCAPVEVPSHGDFRTTAAAIGESSGRGIYVGYSMGGRLAVQLALDRPDLVDGLVLISASPGIANHARRRRRYLDDLALADRIEANGRETFLDEWLGQPIFEGIDLIQARRHRLTTAPAIASQLRRLSQGIQAPLWDRLAELDMPVALVAGERDPKYVGIATEMLSEIGMNATVEIIPDCSHAVTIEWPGAVATVVVEFAETHFGTSTE
ncbi:MAG: alpha/beta fold hydrolase [Acidimicrobiia bacterium]|nr:alpha/beta fold hydrolase [Acidimicrobiia bacterium]